VVLHMAEVLASQPEIHNRLNVTVLVPRREELEYGGVGLLLANQPELRAICDRRSARPQFRWAGVLGSLYWLHRQRKAAFRPRFLKILSRKPAASSDIDWQIWIAWRDV